MQSEKTQLLEKKLAEVAEIHSRTLAAFEAAEIDSATRKEYKRQIDQFESMYQSLEQMKSISKEEKTVASLVEKQLALLQERAGFEAYCLNLWK